MKIAVISDIHGNAVALKQVLQAIDALQPDSLFCLGDIVGYGPEPETCIRLIRERADVILAGNHDLAVVGAIDIDHFNPIAREAVLWHREHLSEESLAWLASLSPRVDLPDLTLSHGSPREPIWEYVTEPETAAENYDAFDTQIGLIGHSHLAIAWQLHRADGGIEVARREEAPGTPLKLVMEDKWLLNPGSVGQPRDEDPRASFAILDTDIWQWTWHRVAYDIESVEKAILAAGLPEVLGTRLYFGW